MCGKVVVERCGFEVFRKFSIYWLNSCVCILFVLFVCTDHVELLLLIFRLFLYGSDGEQWLLYLKQWDKHSMVSMAKNTLFIF